jgi:membrane fusion protein (multidrug efflux system)
MKKILYFILPVMLLAACGGNDKQAQLKELESQRDALNKQIAELRAELNSENGDAGNGKAAWVRLEQLRPSRFDHTIQVQGTVESDNNILIPAQSGGVVKKIYVSEGQKVQKGQVLAALDGAIYERSIAELKTNLELVTTIFERQQRLWDKKIGSEVQYLQAKTNKDALEKKLATVEEQFRLTKIISPINGTVDQILWREGEAAAPGMGAIRVVDVSDLKISAVLSEKYIGMIEKGDSVWVELPSNGRKFNAKLTAVSQVIDAKNRTFPVEIDLPAGMKDIMPNTIAVLTITDYTNGKALTVPVNVIQRTGESLFLFAAVQKAGGEGGWVAEKREVETGYRGADRVEILHGLSPEEHVVVFGFQDLADGQTVKIATEEGMVSR